MRPMLLAGSVALMVFVGATVIILDRGPAAEAQTTVNVSIGDDWFCNSSFAGGTCDTNIAAGDSVLWTNAGANQHTVTECGDAFAPCPQAAGFDSGTLNNGETFSRAFPTPGTYEYWCNIHGNTMQGRVVVAAAQQTPTPAPTASASPAAGSPTTTPIGTGVAAPTPSRAPAAAPATGGSTADSDVSWSWALIALGGVIVVVAAASGLAVLRRQ
jgi:plastocyanin